MKQKANVRDVTEMERPEIETALERMGAERFHARQICRWIYRRGVSDFANMTDLSKGLRNTLAAVLTVSTPRMIKKEVSVDGTIKYLVGLADGHFVESVFIPETPTVTFCVSTQVGCAMQCSFCLTGRMGLIRNLTAGEIVGQVRMMATDLDMLTRRFNIVMMGMGEPLHNYENTMKALRILADQHGFAVSPRRITLSTVGVLPGLERLATESLMPNLAVSLHATTEGQRDRLVPINRKYDVAALVAACRRFPCRRRSRITFEYVMLKGVNDTPEDARRLVALLAGIRSKVNLIPLNEAAGIPFERPSDDSVDRFAETLASHHLTVSVRKSRGRDIRAGCGQLIVEGQRRSPGQQAAALIDA